MAKPDETIIATIKELLDFRVRRRVALGMAAICTFRGFGTVFENACTPSHHRAGVKRKPFRAGRCAKVETLMTL